MFEHFHLDLFHLEVDSRELLVGCGRIGCCANMNLTSPWRTTNIQRTAGIFWRSSVKPSSQLVAFYSLAHVAKSLKSRSQSTSAKTESSLKKSIP